MKAGHLRHSYLRAFAALVLIIVLAAAVTSRTAAAVRLPNSMASTGDSMTRAFNTGLIPFSDAPSNSWSTGTNATVNSMYRRILALNSAIGGKNYNDAKTGASMADLNGQVLSAISQNVDYVTILMGANDVCASSESAMTPVQTFHDQFTQAMESLKNSARPAQVYVVSIPDVYHLWELFHKDQSARTAWAAIGLCQSMLANPTSTAQADVDRRARVRQRNIDFNAQLQQVCALYPQCHFDGNAVFDAKVLKRDVSTRDYFHPSLDGQAKLATVAWNASGLAP
jgi:lysophospholipase L1-like esterase